MKNGTACTRISAVLQQEIMCTLCNIPRLLVCCNIAVRKVAMIVFSSLSNKYLDSHLHHRSQKYRTMVFVNSINLL